MKRCEAALVERLRVHRGTDADGGVRTLSVVVHTGGGRWTADLSALLEEVEIDANGEVGVAWWGGYVLVDGTRPGGDDAPRRNLAVTLVELNSASSTAAGDAAMRAMAGWLPESLAASAAMGSQELVTRRFLGWLGFELPGRFPDEAADLVATLTQDLLPRGGGMTLLAERAREWEQQWLSQGMAQGLDHERELLVRQAARKFDGGTAELLGVRLADVADFARFEEVGEWIIDCGTGAELLRMCR